MPFMSIAHHTAWYPENNRSVSDSRNLEFSFKVISSWKPSLASAPKLLSTTGTDSTRGVVVFATTSRGDICFPNEYTANSQKQEGAAAGPLSLAQCLSQCWERGQLSLLSHGVILLKASEPHPAMLSLQHPLSPQPCCQEAGLGPSLAGSDPPSFTPPPCSRRGVCRDSSSTLHLPCLCPFAEPGSCLLVGRLCGGRWAGPLCLPFSTFILLEKELQPEAIRKGKARPEACRRLPSQGPRYHLPELQRG